ncbi:hypothetical protein BASA81_000806 [Batrachochytrium salamandrivorans]|nr:hypothetical protein BASA81_000806 [Batrachochytrium salamandrivorans]
MNHQATIGLAVGLATTAYVFRRYFMVVPAARPCRVLPRNELQLHCKSTSTLELEIKVLEDSKLEHAKDQALNSRAFSSYLMCAWWLDGVSISRPRLLQIMDFMGLCVRSICLNNGGFALCANNTVGDMVASCRVAYYNRTEANQDDWIVLRGLFNGEIGLPWFALCFPSRKFFKRMTRSMNAMESNRLVVVKELDEYLYLIHLATDPEKQRTGAGTKLLQAIALIADERQLPVYLETDCPKLRRFYENNGFEVKVNYVVEDEDDPFLVNFGMLRQPQKKE